MLEGPHIRSENQFMIALIAYLHTWIHFLMSCTSEVRGLRTFLRRPKTFYCPGLIDLTPFATVETPCRI